MVTLRRSASAALPATADIVRVGPLERRERKLFLAFLIPGLVLATGAIFIPVLYAIQLSFFHAESFIDRPVFVGLANYVRIFSDPRYWEAFWHGITYAVATVTLQVIIGIAIALLLHQEFRGRAWLRSASLAPYILPTVVVVYIWTWLLNMNHGLINNFLDWTGIGAVGWFETPFAAWFTIVFVSVWHWTPFVIITFLAALQTISEDLYDAASVDGAHAWQQFIHVTLPVLKPVLVVIIMLRTIFMFNKFDIVWLLTRGGPLTSTEHLPILAYLKTFDMFDIGGGTAVATSIFVFLTLLIWLYFRLFPIEETD